MSVFNIKQRKEFRGKGKLKTWDRGGVGEEGKITIGFDEIMIAVYAKGNYMMNSRKGEEILKISEDGDGNNAITEMKNSNSF